MRARIRLTLADQHVCVRIAETFFRRGGNIPNRPCNYAMHGIISVMIERAIKPVIKDLLTDSPRLGFSGLAKSANHAGPFAGFELKESSSTLT